MDRVCKKTVHETQFVTLKPSGMTFLALWLVTICKLCKKNLNRPFAKMIWQDKLQKHDPKHKSQNANTDPHHLGSILYYFEFCTVLLGLVAIDIAWHGGIGWQYDQYNSTLAPRCECIICAVAPPTLAGWPFASLQSCRAVLDLHTAAFLLILKDFFDNFSCEFWKVA